MKKYREIAGLFLQFLKFGCFTFGGGWSIVAQMQKLYVEDKKTITGQELIDLTSVGRSLPGTMIGNVAYLYGYHIAGILGGIACVIAMVTPPLMILSIVTYAYSVFRDNQWVMAAMMGVRAAVVPIIASAVAAMVKSAYKYPPCIVVTIITFSLYLFLNVNSVWLVIVGVVLGLLISEYYERKDGGGNGAD